MKRDLFLRQKELLATLLEHGAISQAQHDKSLGDLTEKMGMRPGFRFFSGLQLFRLQQGDNALPGCFKNSTSGDFRIFPVFSLAEMSYLHF